MECSGCEIRQVRGNHGSSGCMRSHTGFPNSKGASPQSVVALTLGCSLQLVAPSRHHLPGGVGRQLSLLARQVHSDVALHNVITSEALHIDALPGAEFNWSLKGLQKTIHYDLGLKQKAFNAYFLYRKAGEQSSMIYDKTRLDKSKQDCKITLSVKR